MTLPVSIHVSARLLITMTVAALLAQPTPATALVGGATGTGDSGAGHHVVMVVGTRGSLCSGTALAPSLVLTAAHCVAPAATYRVFAPEMTPPGIPLLTIAVYPQYSAAHYSSGRVTADVALLLGERSLPTSVKPAPLAATRKVSPGDAIVVAGYGATLQDSETGIGVARSARLIATGKPGNLQIRLMDATTRNQRAGLGACTGDSGGPAFVEVGGVHAVIGVVSWSTGPAGSEGCGGLTGVTPLALYREWIINTAKKLGVTLRR